MCDLSWQLVIRLPPICQPHDQPTFLGLSTFIFHVFTKWFRSIKKTFSDMNLVKCPDNWVQTLIFHIWRTQQEILRDRHVHQQQENLQSIQVKGAWVESARGRTWRRPCRGSLSSPKILVFFLFYFCFMSAHQFTEKKISCCILTWANAHTLVRVLAEELVGKTLQLNIHGEHHS